MQCDRAMEHDSPFLLRPSAGALSCLLGVRGPSKRHPSIGGLTGRISRERDGPARFPAIEDWLAKGRESVMSTLRVCWLARVPGRAKTRSRFDPRSVETNARRGAERGRKGRGRENGRRRWWRRRRGPGGLREARLDRRSPRINQIRERFVFVTPTWAPRRDACVTGVTKPARVGTAGEKPVHRLCPPYTPRPPIAIYSLDERAKRATRVRFAFGTGYGSAAVTSGTRKIPVKPFTGLFPTAVVPSFLQRFARAWPIAISRLSMNI